MFPRPIHPSLLEDFICVSTKAYICTSQAITHCCDFLRLTSHPASTTLKAVMHSSACAAKFVIFQACSGIPEPGRTLKRRGRCLWCGACYDHGHGNKET